MLTFVPDSPLQLGVTYRFVLEGVTDGSFNTMRPFQIVLETYKPQRTAASVGTAGINGTVRDIAFLDIPVAKPADACTTATPSSARAIPRSSSCST